MKCRATTWSGAEKSHIGTCGDGNFVFVSNVSVSVLSNKVKLNLALNEFISKASSISSDFGETHESIMSNLRRRRALVKAYNKTML